MGYACPVCETPQRDGEHLANHLAFTAMLHGDEHEDWLDEHVDDWGDRTPADLATEVTEFAEETEYDEVFEDTAGATGGSPRGERGANATREHADAGHGHGHDHVQGDEIAGRPEAAGRAAGDTGEMARAVTDEAVESVLSEARELTEEMYGGDATGSGDTGDDDAGDDDAEATESADEGSDGEE
ncbi:DUF5810 domain-containing protein [Halobaculum rarum]|uniref:DUF5810 domain-containing protein n=1 Tax=Halobaculum rarum TaxID=3075122 RepID=UPI0032AF2E60